MISTKSNAKNRPKFLPKIIYEGRARIEQTFGKHNRFKRVALRFEKIAESLSSIVSLTFGFTLLKSVLTAAQAPLRNACAGRNGSLH